MKLAQSIFEAYQSETVEDFQEALKDIGGPLFEAMVQGEMNHHLGYDLNSKNG
ncbi:TPA: IS256 family transposase, partial [Bacillus cereus]|nr:IS256 family transposase [Bacillus cereus]